MASIEALYDQVEQYQYEIEAMQKSLRELANLIGPSIATNQLNDLEDQMIDLGKRVNNTAFYLRGYVDNHVTVTIN